METGEIVELFIDKPLEANTNTLSAKISQSVNGINLYYINKIDGTIATKVGLQKLLNKKVKFEIINPCIIYTGISYLIDITTINLLNTKLSAGIYKTIFKADDLPSGIYFSKLTVDGRTSTGKLVLTK